MGNSILSPGVTLPLVQTAFDSGTTVEKAAFQSSVSADCAKLTAAQQVQQTDGATTALLNTAKTALLDPVSGAEIDIGGGITISNAHAADRNLFAPIYYAEFLDTLEAEFPEPASLTVAFARNFQLAGLGDSGVYADAANNVPMFAYVPSVRRKMLQLSSNVTSLTTGLTHRDLTQAGWVKTNTSAAKTAIGIGGITNSASVLTATGDDGTCLFSATAAAATRTVQAWVMRTAGRGRVWMTGDGGVKWIDVTSSLKTSEYTRCSFKISGENPVFGFCLEFSGDAVSVDCFSVVASAYPIAPLLGRADSASSQTLLISGAKPAGSSKSFALSADVVFQDDPAVSLQLTDGAAGILSVMFSGGVNGLPAVQLVSNTGTVIYNTLPSIIYGQASVSPGQTVRLMALYAGGAILVFVNDRLISIYDVPSPAFPATHNIDSYEKLKLVGNGNTFVANVRVDEWTGELVTLLGDSLSTVEVYRSNMIAALGAGAVVLKRGVGGNTIADVRDRIATNLAYALPASNTCWVVLWCGTNSLANNIGAATCLSQLQEAINNILAINGAAKILALTTITQRTAGLTGLTAEQFMTNAQAYNNGLSTLTGITQLVEVNGTDMGVDTSTAAALQDGIHLKWRYYPALCRKISAAMASAT